MIDLVGNRLHKSHHAQAAKRVGNVSTVYDDVLEEISYDYSVSDAMALNLYDRLRLETIDRTTATRPSGGGSPVTSESLTRHSYAYDANGAQTQKSPAHWDAGTEQWIAEPQHVEHYRFDLRGRLAQLDNVYGRQTDTAISAGRMNSVNHYDHRNLRVRLDQDMLGANPADPYSTQTLFLVDHHSPTGYAQVVESRTDYEKILDGGVEPDVNRTLKALHSYVWGRGVIAQDGNLMVTDHQGTVRRTVGGWQWRYDAFGVPSDVWKVDQLFNVIRNTTENPFAHRYTGEYFDAGIGLQFNRARWLNLTTASFVGADPFDGSLAHPLTLPKYWYAAADGVNKSDPSGRVIRVTGPGGLSETINDTSLIYAQNSLDPVKKRVLDIMIGSDHLYSVTPESLTLELSLRSGIVSRARQFARLNRAFNDSTGITFPGSSYWAHPGPDLDDEFNTSILALKNSGNPANAVRELFDPQSQLRCECKTAVTIVYFAGLLDALGDAQFNAVIQSQYIAYGKTVEISPGHDPLDVLPVKNPADFLPGDWVNFLNPGADSPWHNENAILLDDGKYFAHPFGVTEGPALIAVLNDVHPERRLDAHLRREVVNRYSIWHLLDSIANSRNGIQ